ncbi:MAG TPA: D-alanyl-D-alanine carboxypeptidase family protein [Hyphomonadaceae bacterium]|jgi:D-alanyl-D-alanine carboxypeptidase (penicillin-binding protein 5/6)|nr:D-alanyl-D-alanine carboxypeptidase family protein [Hyphomonadaceae bacterium]
MRFIAGTLLALAATASTAFAQQPAQPAAPDPTQQAAAFGSDPLNTNATYAFIMDGDTGLPLYSKRGDEAMVPASMSKLMLYYIVFDRIRAGRLKLTDEFTVSEHAWRTGGAGTDGSTMFLPLNSKVSVENLLHGAIIVSGNDACITLAEGIAGSEEAYAREATAKAQELGLKNSHFANASGLDDPGERMSAHDIATLAYRIIKEFPEHYKMFSEPSFTWNKITQPNRNPLLKEVPGADGVKTGHLAVSGFGLVGSAIRDGKRRIIVLQGLASEGDRRKEAPVVMRKAFTDFTAAKLVDKDAQVAEAKVWLGEKDTVPLVAAEEASAGLHVDAMKGLKSKVVYKGPLYAPVKKGDAVGELIISAPGAPDIKIPVVAGADVKQLGFIGKAMQGLRGDDEEEDEPKDEKGAKDSKGK